MLPERMIYSQKVSGEVRRLLSLVDRNAASRTYGCLDRRYWSWRIGDMPNASLQYGVYPLAWLWTNSEDDRYRSNDSVLEWIMAGLDYWAGIQNRNGSFNQFFPNEQSVGTTYYTLAACLYAFEKIRSRLNSDLRIKVETAIGKASDFLLKNEEAYAVISNHIALFAYVNLRLSMFLNDNRFRDRALRQLQTVFDHQSPEGWFLEYEGADPGYQTQCIYYLAECYFLAGDPEILERVKRSVEDFLVFCFHPDGSFGGEYGSRNTELIYPAGFEMLGNELPVFRQIADFIRSGLSKGSLVSLDSLDDENLIRLVTNYMIASECASTDDESSAVHLGLLPCDRSQVLEDFPQTGVFVRGNERYYSIVNTNKGGIIKVFDRKKRKLVYEDNGYFVKIGERVVTNQVMERSDAVVKNGSIEFQCCFYEVLDGMLTPFTNILLRTLAVTLFRRTRIVDMFRRILVRKAFTNKKRYGIRLHRLILFGDDLIDIEDNLTKDGGLRVSGYVVGRKQFALKMASSNYHSDKDLLSVSPALPKIVELNENNAARISNRIMLKEVP